MNKKYFCILMFLFLMISCKNKSYKMEEIYPEKVYVYVDEYGFGDYVFFINGKFYTIRVWNEDFFNTFPSDDSIIENQIDRIYYKQTIYSFNIEYDTIEIANSLKEFPRNSAKKVFLYNLRIIDIKWEVSLYHPCSDIKGTYSFNITESENNIFKGILNVFQENAKQKYYPIQNQTRFSSQNPADALYLKIQSKREQSEYFGAITTPIYDSITKFYMLSQIINIIIGNHISPDNNDNKINDTIQLLDIRERFDYYVGRDCCTGYIVKDFDSIVPPDIIHDFCK